MREVSKNVAPERRCKTIDIGSNKNVEKSIRKVCNIWQTSAELSKKVTFGEQATTEASRRRTTAPSGTYQKVSSSIDKIGKIVVKPLGKRRCADNLLNNNIYKRIKNTTTIISWGADPL